MLDLLTYAMYIYSAAFYVMLLCVVLPILVQKTKGDEKSD